MKTSRTILIGALLAGLALPAIADSGPLPWPPDAPTPSCGQLLMKPYASGEWNSWGLVLNGAWHQAGGTPVQLSTPEAIAQLVTDGVCIPNRAPVPLADATQGDPSSALTISTEQDSSTEQLAAEMFPFEVRHVVVALALIAICGYFIAQNHRGKSFDRHESISMAPRERIQK